MTLAFLHGPLAAANVPLPCRCLFWRGRFCSHDPRCGRCLRGVLRG